MLGLESRLKTPRVLLSLVAASSLLQAIYFVADTPHSAAHLATVVLDLLVAGFAIGYLRTRDWQFVWVGLAGAALEVVPFLIHWQRGSVTLSLRLLLCAAALCHAALFTLVLLLGSRRVSPRTACLVSLLPALLVFAAEALLEWRARQRPSLFLTREQEPAANQLATAAWPEPLCAEHPLWGTTAKPNRYLRQLVSVDDAGRLHPVDYYGHIPPKSFRLVKATGVNASVAFPHENPPRVRTDIVQPGTEAWQLQLNTGPHPVLARARYCLRFRARSTASPRPLAIALAQLHEPWTNLGLLQTLDLPSDWQSFQLGFMATQTEPVAGLLFQGGGDANGWEIADCRLELVSPPGELPHDLRGWEPFVEPGNVTRIVLMEDMPERLVLQVPAEKTAAVSSRLRAICRGIRVTQGQQYELRVTARSEPPTTVTLLVTQNHEPWGPLGLYHQVPLNRSLRQHRLRFTAKATDDNGSLGIEFPPDCQVELQDSELRPATADSNQLDSTAWTWRAVSATPTVKTEIRQAPGTPTRLLWKLASQDPPAPAEPPGWFVKTITGSAAPRYFVRILARADQDVKLRVGLADGQQFPRASAPQTLSLTSSWTWYYLHLLSGQATAPRLALQPAAPLVGVEIAVLDVVPYGDEQPQALFSSLPFAVSHEINSLGFRDQEHSSSTPDGTARLALFGDSIAFGIGVPADARFADILERQLNDLGASASHPRVDVLHCATPGWGIRQSHAAFQEFCSRYSVQLALFVLSPNDDTSYDEELSAAYRKPVESYRPLFRLLDLLPGARVPSRPGAARFMEELDAVAALAARRGIPMAIAWVDPHPTSASQALAAAVQLHAQKARLAWLSWPGPDSIRNQPGSDRLLTVAEQPLTRKEHQQFASALVPFLSSLLARPR